ncbi:MAG: PIN domain-containing protein [Spirochaetaceae bacterium]|nr:PIN domain-containing protein [Spirochaetaceae bacterium]
MIVPDVNLILYAYDQDGPFHRESAEWWSRCLNGAEAVGLAPVVVFGFIRLSTSPRIYAEPLSLEECAGIVRSWLPVPATTLLEHDAGDIDVALDLLDSAGAGGNLTTDAQIGALALRYRATVHTADTDFSRLREVRWRNPLTGQHGPR